MHSGQAPPVYRRETRLRSDGPERAASSGAELDDYVANAAAGDVRAFEHLYRTHLPRVHSLVRRMSGGRDVDELTQDVFVRVWQEARKLPRRFGVRHLAASPGRQRGDRALPAGCVAPPAAARRRGDLRHPSGAGARATYRWTSRRRCSRSPTAARQIFVLHDVEGYKHHEIGELLDISSGTSKAQLHRARMMLEAVS